ncbi:ABC transporter permease [Pedobacter sp. N36a]|uniref:ABC transporter permease n=1 Tax=Pedobacter sp. N36a TaxID=2767996 RepID=UPI001CA39811|nr:FtsX-like permease family protein [Pedobacter sp. N36a]
MRYDKPKSIGIIVGIVISIFLIGQQLGTLRFLTGLMSGLIVNSNSSGSDIWIIDNITGNVNALSRIDSRIAQEVKSINGVEDSYGVVIANATATFEGSKTSPVNLIGSEGPLFIAGPNPSKILTGSLDELYQSDAISAEFFNSKNLGVNLELNKTFEINNKAAIIKVMTKNAQGFGGYYMYTNISNARFYGNFPNDKLSIVVVKVKKGVNIENLVNRINQTFYGVKAWKVDDLKNSTLSEILITSNIGVSFGSLVIFAMISGFFIIGLTLYSSALDRLVDYGTLKAIGASNGFVSRLILTQAMLFALIGFIIALLLLVLFKNGVASAGLLINLDWPLIMILLGVTLFMSVGGSLFAVVKISRLEPASIF